MLLSIEKLIYGGDGLARLPADEAGRGKAVFLPFVLAGERVEATLTEQRPGFARAKVDGIVERSAHRIEPRCRYFGKCGGCHYQHADYGHQVEIKKEILRETLRRTAKIGLEGEIEVHASEPWNYRNRSRLQVRAGAEFVLGYNRMGSHEVLAVEECPISSVLINRGIGTVWRSGRAGRVPEGVGEIEFFADAEDAQLLVEVSCEAEARRAEVRNWAEELRAEMPEIAGVVAFRSQTSHAVSAKQAETRMGQPSSDKLVTSGADHLIYRTERGAYRVSAGAFFQTNRFLVNELMKIVTAGQKGEQALDLYAGVGLFSTALAGDFHHIISVESSQTSSGDLAYNLGAKGDAVGATTEQYLSGDFGRRKLGSGRRAGARGGLPSRPELVVVDPPRNGLGERVARALGELGAERMVYGSCDPATLARDLVHLLGAGYRVEKVHVVDLFPQTFHLESVVKLSR